MSAEVLIALINLIPLLEPAIASFIKELLAGRGLDVDALTAATIQNNTDAINLINAELERLGEK